MFCKCFILHVTTVESKIMTAFSSLSCVYTYQTMPQLRSSFISIATEALWLYSVTFRVGISVAPRNALTFCPLPHAK